MGIGRAGAAAPTPVSPAWPWAFALLALGALALVGWLAWRLGRAQGTAAAAAPKGAAAHAGRRAGGPGGSAPSPAADAPATEPAAPAGPLEAPGAAALLGALLAAEPHGAWLLARRAGDTGWSVLACSDEPPPPWPQAAARELARLAAGGSAVLPDLRVWRLPPLADGTALGLVRARPAEPPRADAADPGELEQMTFTLSHDLRAPIRVVDGFARILKEDYGTVLDALANDHLDRVLGAAARMNAMIDALLALARLSQQPMARQPVDLSRLAQFVVEDLRRATPQREVRVEIEPGLVAEGDPTLLRLVLENLLGNAWKYTAHKAQAHVSLAAERVGGRAGYVVRDDGAGFDMRAADRLFGLFQRLHAASEFPGTGVGLASVRRIVRRHGGEIWAEAEPGRGAAFHFTLGG